MIPASEIRRIRAQTRMDKAKFGRAVGVPVSTIDLWELGMAHPSPWEETKLNNLIPGRAADQLRLAETIKKDQAEKAKSNVQTVLFPGGGAAWREKK